MPLHLCARIAGNITITSMPKTSPENLLGAVFSAEMAMMSVLHGLSNDVSAARPEMAMLSVHHKTRSAEQTSKGIHSLVEQCCTAC